MVLVIHIREENVECPRMQNYTRRRLELWESPLPYGTFGGAHFAAEAIQAFSLSSKDNLSQAMVLLRKPFLDFVHTDVCHCWFAFDISLG